MSYELLYLPPLLHNSDVGFRSGLGWLVKLIDRFFDQLDRIDRTGGHAQSAADAPVQVDCRNAVGDSNGVHLTSLQTGFTARAFGLINQREIIALYHFSR